MAGALLLDIVLRASSFRCLKDVRFQNSCSGSQPLALHVLQDGHFTIKTADGQMHFTEGPASKSSMCFGKGSFRSRGGF